MSLKWETFWQKEVSDICTSDCQVIKRLGFLSFFIQLDTLEVSVHRHVDAGYRANDDRAVLELDGHGLAGELHQEFNQLHFNL